MTKIIMFDGPAMDKLLRSNSSRMYWKGIMVGILLSALSGLATILVWVVF